MKKSLIVAISFFICLQSLSAKESSPDFESLKVYLENKISQCESDKKILTDPSDIYTLYLIHGKQTAYEEILEKLDNKKIKTNNGSFCNHAPKR